MVDVDGLIKTYMPLAHLIATQVWRTAPHALELDELTGIAYLALCDCANRWQSYCAKNGYNAEHLQFFKPYVARRVYGALIDANRSADWATRSLRTRAKMLQEAGQDKGVPEQELARRSGLTVKEVRQTIHGMSQRPVSLEAEELEPAARSGVESDAFTSDVLSAMVETIRALEPELQIVLSLHYFKGLHLQEVARSMGISESRASHFHAKAVLAVHQGMVNAAQYRENAA